MKQRQLEQVLYTLSKGELRYWWYDRLHVQHPPLTAADNESLLRRWYDYDTHSNVGKGKQYDEQCDEQCDDEMCQCCCHNQ